MTARAPPVRTLPPKLVITAPWSGFRRAIRGVAPRGFASPRAATVPPAPARLDQAADPVLEWLGVVAIQRPRLFAHAVAGRAAGLARDVLRSLPPGARLRQSTAERHRELVDPEVGDVDGIDRDTDGARVPG